MTEDGGKLRLPAVDLAERQGPHLAHGLALALAARVGVARDARYRLNVGAAIAVLPEHFLHRFLLK